MQNKITASGTYVYTLDKKGQEIEAGGVFEVKKGEKLIVTTDMQFMVAETNGKVHVKAVVHEGGYVEFRGKIIIAKGAVNANGYLKQEVLLMGPGALAVCVPELEIECNEVKASHAASVSTFDKEQLFYLQSRGVTLSEARETIVRAWLG